MHYPPQKDAWEAERSRRSLKRQIRGYKQTEWWQTDGKTGADEIVCGRQTVLIQRYKAGRLTGESFSSKPGGPSAMTAAAALTHQQTAIICSLHTCCHSISSGVWTQLYIICSHHSATITSFLPSKNWRIRQLPLLVPFNPVPQRILACTFGISGCQ